MFVIPCKEATSISSHPKSETSKNTNIASDQTSHPSLQHATEQTDSHTPKSSTGNIYLSAQNLGSGKIYTRSQTPPVYQSSSNGSSRRDSIQVFNLSFLVRNLQFMCHKIIFFQVPIYSSNRNVRRSTGSIKRQSRHAIPRTRRLSNNSPIIRRCSLQEDHSILMFAAQRKKKEKAARRKSLDIIEIREDVRHEEDGLAKVGFQSSL